MSKLVHVRYAAADQALGTVSMNVSAHAVGNEAALDVIRFSNEAPL